MLIKHSRKKLDFLDLVKTLCRKSAEPVNSIICFLHLFNHLNIRGESRSSLTQLKIFVGSRQILRFYFFTIPLLLHIPLTYVIL